MIFFKLAVYADLFSFCLSILGQLFMLVVIGQSFLPI